MSIKLDEYNFGEFDARREYLRNQEFFLNSFVENTNINLDRISNRDNFIIVGQKGSGKTALQYFLAQKNQLSTRQIL